MLTCEDSAIKETNRVYRENVKFFDKRKGEMLRDKTKKV